MKGALAPTLIIITFLSGLSIIAVRTGILEGFWKTQNQRNEESQKLGFLYLVYVESGHKYVKIFDPVTQTIEEISNVVLSPGSSTFNYANGKLFYLLSPYPGSDFPDAIVSHDLRTGQRHQLVRAYSANPDENRIVKSYLVAQNSIFFLDCVLNSITFRTSDCILKQVHLRDGQKTETTTLLNLDDVFKETDSSEKIVVYNPRRNALILSEVYAPTPYEAGVFYYYEVSLDGAGTETLSEEKMRQILSEFGEIDKGCSSSLSLESEVFGNAQHKVLIGCFNLEELKSLSQ